MPNMKIDFYRVVMPPNAARTFESIIQEVLGGPNDDGRNLDVGKHPCRLQDGGRWQRAIEGDMLRIRMNMLPVKASLSGEVSNIDFDDDEGIGEETAFLYHPPLGVLAIQRNRYGVSPSGFLQYMEHHGHVNEPIILEPILRPGVMERMARMAVVRKFDVRVAGLQNGQLLRGQGHSLGAIATIIEELNAPSVSVSVSMDRNRNGGLNRSTVVNTARALMRIGARDASPVRTLELTGQTEDGEQDVIDLIEDRMQDVVEVEQDETRRVPYSVRRDEIRAAWDRCRSEIVRVLPAQED